MVVWIASPGRLESAPWVTPAIITSSLASTPVTGTISSSPSFSAPAAWIRPAASSPVAETSMSARSPLTISQRPGSRPG